MGIHGVCMTLGVIIGSYASGVVIDSEHYSG